MPQAPATRCPNCEGNDVQRIRYGLFEMDGDDNRNVVLGGCEPGPSNPDFRCTACGEEWTGSGSDLKVSLARRVERDCDAAGVLHPDVVWSWICGHGLQRQVFCAQPPDGIPSDDARLLMDGMVGLDVRHAHSKVFCSQSDDRAFIRLFVLLGEGVLLVQDAAILCEDGESVEHVSRSDYPGVVHRFATRVGTRLSRVDISGLEIALTFEDGFRLRFPSAISPCSSAPHRHALHG